MACSILCISNVNQGTDSFPSVNRQLASKDELEVENWNVEELPRDQRCEFAFIGVPLKFQALPIAIATVRASVTRSHRQTLDRFFVFPGTFASLHWGRESDRIWAISANVPSRSIRESRKIWKNIP